MKGKFKSVFLFFGHIVLFSILFIGTHFFLANSSVQKNYLFKQVQEVFFDKTKEHQLAHATLEKKVNASSDTHLLFSSLTNRSSTGLFYFVYQHDSLVFWSSNAPVIPPIYVDSLFSQPLIQLSKSWYMSLVTKQDSFRLVTLLVVKKQYPYHNEYLRDSWFGDDERFSSLDFSSKSGECPLFTTTNNRVGYVSLKEEVPIPYITWVVIAYILLLLYLLYLFYLGYNYLRPLLSEFQLHLFFWLDSCLLLGMMLYFQYPSVIFTLDFFQPHVYASSLYIPSLAHLFIYSLLLTYLSYIIVRYFSWPYMPRKSFFSIANKPLSWVVSCLIFGLIGSSFYGVLWVIETLFVDSSIFLEFNTIFKLNGYSYITLFIVFLLFFAHFLFIYRLWRYVANMIHGGIYLFIVVIICLGFYFSISSSLLAFQLCFWMVLLAAFFYVQKYYRKPLSFLWIVIILIIYAFFTAQFFYQLNEQKDIFTRTLLADRLSSEKDPLLEKLFDDKTALLQQDVRIKSYLAQPIVDEDGLINYIHSTYFKGYFQKFTPHFTLCLSGDNILIDPNQPKVSCSSFFTHVIEYQGEATLSQDLYLIKNTSGQVNYLGQLSFPRSSDTLHIYIDLINRKMHADQGYPNLLVDEKYAQKNPFENYSYAKYYKGMLVATYGEYKYPLKEFSLHHLVPNSSLGSTTFTYDGYSHYYFVLDSGKAIIVSKKQLSFINSIAPFSYIFLFYLLVLVAIGLIYFPYSIFLVDWSFRLKLQFSMVVLLLLSFVFIGISTILYMLKMNENKNYDSLIEKGHSIVLELEDKLGYMSTISPEMIPDIQATLSKFSSIFFTDITFFNVEGSVIAASRPEIYDGGLKGSQLNPIPYYSLHYLHQSKVIAKESIGNLSFYSAYLPFRNYNDDVIAYINLPYFVKETTLKQEISSFISTFINLYLIIIALSIVVLLVLSNYITRPLQLLKQSMSHLTLQKKNKKIDWHSNDEIGNIIAQYNKMIDELEISAEKLALSEREEAWREMAKQVAHEIKNPLTPLKLSIQYLEKARQENHPDWEERFKKFTKTAVDQIDTLSRIATDFSDFAKIATITPERIALEDFIPSMVALYNEPAITFSILPIPSSALIYFDRNQLLRVSNNLIKNSIQALSNSTTTPQLIEISCQVNDSFVTLSFYDNGPGIPEAVKPYIFTPNFTTKTSGTGLGLAMVKQIITQAKGEIWFESILDSQTTFYIKLPLAPSIG